MKNRRVLFGEGAVIGLDGLCISMNTLPTLRVLPFLDVEAIIYRSLILCGADYFDLVTPNDMIISQHTWLRTKSEFLQKRLNKLDRNATDWVPQIVKLFVEFLPRNIPIGDRVTSNLVGVFLGDLIFAMERGTALATLHDLPSEEEIDRIFPPEIGIPIQGLISMMRPETAALAVPCVSVESESVARFKEILTSDFFKSYQESHEDLSAPSVSRDRSLDRLKSSGRTLQRRFPQLLSMKKFAISTLPVTSKVIGAVFGKLPGAFADYAVKALEGALGAERKTIIYRLSGIQDQIFKKSGPQRLLLKK